jgi:prepilin-type N-terminal cleavage/methylation domain-containing protein
MKSKTNIFQNQKGVSLVELLVVIMIITIISTIALMQFGSSKNQFRRQNVAQELKTAFERARFDSVKRRAEEIIGTPTIDTRAKVTVNTNSFTLTVDKNGNGTIEQPDDDSVNNFGSQNVTITDTAGITMTSPVTVFYNKRGEVTDNAGIPVNPIFIVCNGTCTSTPNSSNSNIVLVTPTGTVNLLAGGSAIPVFPTPAVTSVPAATNIKRDVTLP